MKKIILASAVASAFAAQGAYAADAAPAAPAAPAATPEHVVTYNMGVTSDYVFRGISQSRNGPAISGGVDYAHSPTGVYAGTWASSISWVNDADLATTAAARSNTPFELDLYGGLKGDFAGVAYDVGGIYYYYHGHKLKGTATGLPEANTFEVYGKVGYGPVYFKVNYAIGPAIAVTDKAGSYYLDLGADYPLIEGLLLNLHYGRWSFANSTTTSYTDSNYSYNDWKVGLTKDFGSGFSGAIAATGTDAKNLSGGTYYWNFGSPPTGYLGGNKIIASLTKTF